MKKEITMFNKKLIAGSILAIASSAALAAPSFTFTKDTYSAQGSKSQAVFTGPDVIIQSGAELSNDDLIKMTYSSAFDTTNAPSSNVYMYATCVGQTDGTATVTENGGVVTLGLLSDDSTSVTYRVTDITFATTTANTANTGCTGDVGVPKATENSTVGASWTLAGGKFEGDALRTTTLSGIYHATLPNGTTDIDGGAIQATSGGVTAMIDFDDQFDLDVTALAADGFSKVIDVTMGDDARSDFVDVVGEVDGLIATDVLTIQLNETDFTAGTGVALSAATGEVVTAVVTGDFSFLADENDNAADGVTNDSVTATVNAQAAASVTITATDITVVGDPADVGDIVITFDNTDNGNGKAAMVAGSFTSAVSIAYNDAGVDGTNATADDLVAGTSVESTANSAGAWTLNGSNSVVEAYPVGAGITQFLWVTNTGSETAGISVTAIGDGGTLASCDVGSVAANDLTYIAGLVNDCLSAEPGFGTDRIQLTVTVNAAKDTIDVYAGYKVDADSDRLHLPVYEL
jgi:hypothetical protein